MAGRSSNSGEDVPADKDEHASRRVGDQDVTLGNRIRVRRTELGMSQAELGSALGLSFQQVQKYEKGKNRITAHRLQEIAKVLRMPLNFFYGGSANKLAADAMISRDPKYNLRLLRAYNAIPDLILKRKLVTLMERMAGIADVEEE
jgi:transcriptional regulator with XRE-family HTH domain